MRRVWLLCVPGSRIMHGHLPEQEIAAAMQIQGTLLDRAGIGAAVLEA